MDTLMKVDQDTALGLSKNDLTLLDMGAIKKGSTKENESCRTRNSIRLGCSSIHEYIRQLQKELEDEKNKKRNKKTQKRNNGRKKKSKKNLETQERKKQERRILADNNPLQRCTLCNGPVLSCEHILLQCSCKPKTVGLDDIIADALRSTNTGFTVTDWNLKTITSRILAPEFWTLEQNNTINAHCKETLAQFHLSKQVKSRDNKLNPRLLKILKDWTPGEELLNENIIGELILLKYTEGVMKGTWRMRVKEYDPFANEFEVDTVGLDFCPISKHWFSPPPANLNDDLRKGYLEFLDKEKELTFNKNIHEAKRQMFNESAVGKIIEIKREGSNVFTKTKIRSYNADTRTHVVAVEGSAARVGASPLDLNALAIKGRIKLEPPAISRMVASRWLAIAQDIRNDPERTAPTLESRGRCRKVASTRLPD